MLHRSLMCGKRVVHNAVIYGCGEARCRKSDGTAQKNRHENLFSTSHDSDPYFIVPHAGRAREAQKWSPLKTDFAAVSFPLRREKNLPLIWNYRRVRGRENRETYRGCHA